MLSNTVSIHLTVLEGPKMRSMALVFTLLISFACQDCIQADLVSDSTLFGGNTVIESFEGISPNGSNLQVATPLVLPTGITVAEPTPNRTDSFSPFIVNGGFFGLGGASSVVPDGTAYLGQANPGNFDNGILLVLPDLSRRVGMFIATATSSTPDAPVEVIFFDDFGGVVGSTITRGVSGVQGDEWKENFVGWASFDGIRSVRIAGSGAGVLRVDAVQFQPVPEPGSGTILVLSLAAFAFRRPRSIAG